MQKIKEESLNLGKILMKMFALFFIERAKWRFS